MAGKRGEGKGRLGSEEKLLPYVQVFESTNGQLVFVGR